ncbi:DUF2254 domain-containing protein [Sulfitobacter geojensis]|uniref:DUF2254 domain-containing protein n=1 Tax=Sulfitobacter geojensis TaxID=1342299 RepID=A0AAE3B796_9RHOB|nr:DUF2254 domain-containing protein [Sulfitobacter geojensis]MBM1689915.1 DUF2254 domain-containing protein [Sulfitobacter geojensis]MBM1693981.1 DUF2254 domain-containing protein [Sulfitobacter geojensis]MBM1706147.1 DUF2254 domain-containing protein [Sulfitobacter geojensis]MBM1710205.1 DUF2254 domain-containing protein [Sulfitobacter geojensis]MBM1714271.1 DUF2254 domain-containing protein [Sulfitobacter geojensis]
MSFSARIKKHLDDIRASYWFVPTVLVLSAILLAFVSLIVDSHPQFGKFRPDWMSDVVSAEGARAIVSVIAQSMIGVAGVMFSITMLAVSFASGQFGPRLIGNFMRDRGNQWTLGILISTFTFALLTLRAIENPHDEIAAFVPHFSIILTMLLALISVFVMIYHVHHVPETISASNIVAGLGRRLTRDVENLLESDPVEVTIYASEFVDVNMRTAGYIHNVAQDRLSAIAKEQGWVIELLEAPGEFMHPHRSVLRVWGATEPLDDEMASRLRGAVALGLAKTEKQNIIFVAEQLVEIVARAMSPGVNDPFTAISCMQWMEAGLSPFVQQDRQLNVYQVEGVRAKPISFEKLLSRSLGDCRTYVQDDALTRDTFLQVLERLSDLATKTNRAPIEALAEQVRSAA